MSEESNNGLDTEKGFGTGLRAQLAKRGEGEAAPAETTAAAPQQAAATEPAFVVFGTAEAEAVKAELAAAGERERDLRDELDELRARLDAAEVAKTEAAVGTIGRGRRTARRRSPGSRPRSRSGSASSRSGPRPPRPSSSASPT